MKSTLRAHKEVTHTRYRGSVDSDPMSWEYGFAFAASSTLAALGVPSPVRWAVKCDLVATLRHRSPCFATCASLAVVGAAPSPPDAIFRRGYLTKT